MRQLSAPDAEFLNIDSDTDVVNVAGPAILDGPLSRQGRDLVPDVWSICRYPAEALEELTALANRSEVPG